MSPRVVAVSLGSPELVAEQPRLRRRHPLRSISGTGPWSPRRRRLTAGIMLTVAAGAFESLAVSTVLPAANRELHDLRHYGLVFSAFMLTNLIGVVVGGRQADSAPPERALLAGTAIFSCGLLITGTAPSMLVLALGRGLQGLGAGGVSGLAMYAVRRCYEEQARPRMLALLSTAWMVPGLLGPSLAAGITALAGWRWVFLGLVPVMPAAALLAISALRVASSQREPDARGTPTAERGRRPVVALSAAVLLALAALSSTGQVAQITLACAAAAIGVPALAGVLPAGTLRLRPGQPAAAAFILLAAIGYFGIGAFVPLALTSIHRASLWQEGLVLTAASVCWTGGTWVQARLAGRVSRRKLLVAGAALTAAGVAVTGYVISTAGAWFWLTAASWAVAGFGMGLTSSTATFIVLQWAKPGAEGQAGASAQLASLLGGAIGTGVAGVIVSDGTLQATSLGSAIRVIGALAVGAVLLAGLAAGRSRSAGATPATPGGPGRPAK